MGDSESKTWPDEIRVKPLTDPAAERREIDWLLREQQQKMDEEMMRAILGPMPPLEHLIPPQRPGSPADSVFNVDPQAYEEWRKGQQKPSVSQIDPKLLERLRQNMGNFPMLRPGHVKVKMNGGGKSNETNPGPPFIDEAHDIFSEVYLGDYPHMEPMTRKQEVCRHHPVNVGFNIDKWVCKICDKDLDTPVDNSYK